MLTPEAELHPAQWAAPGDLESPGGSSSTSGPQSEKIPSCPEGALEPHRTTRLSFWMVSTGLSALSNTLITV